MSRFERSPIFHRTEAEIKMDAAQELMAKTVEEATTLSAIIDAVLALPTDSPKFIIDLETHDCSTITIIVIQGLFRQLQENLAAGKASGNTKEEQDQLVYSVARNIMYELPQFANKLFAVGSTGYEVAAPTEAVAALE